MKNPPLEFVSSPQGRTTHRETKGGGGDNGAGAGGAGKKLEQHRVH